MTTSELTDEFIGLTVSWNLQSTLIGANMGVIYATYNTHLEVLCTMSWIWLILKNIRNANQDIVLVNKFAYKYTLF